MKQKYTIWLNMVTLCLCVCAIMVGVWAANSASLTVSGQVGFVAHGCELQLNGYTITNSSTTESATQATTITNTNTLQINGTTTTPLNLNSFYFVDDLTLNKVPDITITLNIQNKSAFPVTATLTEKISTKYEDIKIVGGTWTKTFGANDNANGGFDENTLTITLSLTDPATADLSNVASGELFSVTFVKDLDAHAEGELYIQNGKLYVEFGNYPSNEVNAPIGNTATTTAMYDKNLGKPIRFIAFSNNLDTENASALVLNEGATTPTTGSYYFVAEFAFDLSAFLNYTGGDYSNIFGDDYADSDIRNYILNDFITKFSLSNLVNNYAVERLLPSEGDAINNCNDKLWLLSSTEAEYVKTAIGSIEAYYPSQATAVASQWWLRSPGNCGMLNRAMFVYGSSIADDAGDWSDPLVTNIYSIRLAFQLDLVS